jgi:3-phenylpropionate/trans-cinnamate dioxygenase ferredoxin subunit
MSVGDKPCVDEWIWVANAEAIGPGEALRVELDGDAIAVWNVEGEFYATSDTCTHEEASLTDGDFWGEVVECPLHGAQFDVRTGAVLSLPAMYPLPTYPVKVEDDGLYLGWNTGE